MIYFDLDAKMSTMGKPGQDNKNETPNFVTILGKAKAKKSYKVKKQ